MAKYTDKTTFWSLELGFNYQWTNIQAALALAQIRRLDELVRQRRQIFKWYHDRLKDVPGILLNSEEKMSEIHIGLFQRSFQKIMVSRKKIL